MMAWQKYGLVFRLHSPLHIGYRTVGNLMQTRGYIPGKNLWAALTARLTRDYDNGTEGRRYVEIGQQIQDHFRFTYLYPATQNDNGFKMHYPWDDDFDYLFLNSYASTALNYTRQSAEDAMLHETEFIAPHTRTGQPVYLTGDLYIKTDLPMPLNNWPEALKKFQVGAERGYGWGRLQLVSCDKQDEPFTTQPRAATHSGHITAHLRAENVTGIAGPVEPLIGWERNNDEDRRSNWKLSKHAIICYAPGGKVTGAYDFTIGQNGLWE
jgi:hypothetical protein